MATIIEIRASNPETTEQLGSKPKFWFRLYDSESKRDERLWLFKYSRSTAGESWSEKVACDIAELLEVEHPLVELAEFEGKHGCASRKFLAPNQGEDLIHGSELLAGHVTGYDKDKVRKHKDHSLKNIFAALKALVPETELPALHMKFAGYMFLDALICNTDRHHDNWGMLRSLTASGASYWLAPSFDHASSLGRELLDEKRKLLLESRQVEAYINKGHGGIFWGDEDVKGENPLQLVLKARQEHPACFAPWEERLKSLASADFERIISNIPADWMSPLAKDFSLELLNITAARLRRT